MTNFNVFIGLNDKDSHAQEISTNDAKRITAQALAATTGAGTIIEAVGVWGGEIETSLNVRILNAERDAVETFAAIVKSALNQQEVLIEEEV